MNMKERITYLLNKYDHYVKCDKQTYIDDYLNTINAITSPNTKHLYI
ncbi:MAG: hypothetical protein KKD75_00495 [Nanoarchaeota archaeon]|nr:hypothetical protein [Nanoarchaeota archaeon]